MASSTLVKTGMNWMLRPDEIKTLSTELVAKSKKVMDMVANAKETTWEAVMKPLADERNEFHSVYSNCEFLQHVSADKAVRDASTEADKLLQDYSIEKDMHEGVYAAVKRFQDANPNITGERKRLVEKTLRDFQRNGLSLSPEKREQAKTLKKRLAELEIDFNKHISEDKSKLLLTKPELAGLPEDFIQGLTKEAEEKYVVTMKYPDITPCLKKALNEDVRRRLEFVYSARCQKENTPLIEEAITLRHQLAQIMGFPTHADFVLDIRMAKKKENVQQFYSELKPKLDTIAHKEIEKLLSLKKTEKERLGQPFDGKVNAWDWQYYHNMLLETEHQIDEDVYKAYFPLEKVLSETLSIYQELLGVRFEKVSTEHVWHSEVTQYQVYDSATSRFIGTFWIDLHPREGKYSHAAAWPLQASCLLPDGTRQFPASAMVCNFTKPTADKPSLLRHNEVETFFHEFGHVMHGICSEVDFAIFSGTAVERDFVECPSQMLENWVWEKDILKRLSSHYVTKEPLRDDLITKLVASKNVNAGLVNLRQMFFGRFDLSVHTQEKVDTEKLWAKLRKEITLIEHTEGTNPAANFGHLMGGYDASYYGYLWAEVFSADLFAQFKSGGVMSRELGKKYRELILRPGGSRDAADMLRDFLGREPLQEAFLASIGLQPGGN